MLKNTLKVVTVLATSAVAVPYAVAFLTHMMWGWPKNYQRAFSPKKVYALSYTILMDVRKIKYAMLKLRWMYFYRTASTDRLIKDLKYGSHNNKLDVYVPVDSQGSRVEGPLPVLVFLYGGSWSSGDKNMYGMLCSQLADNARAIVCCPNYSIYPMGLVDDMVQDVVDCLEWLQQNVHTFGGDKERVALIGHSAGGHLAMLAVLELVQKCLIHNPQSVIMSTEEVAMVTSQRLPRQSSAVSQSFIFEEGYFDTGSEGEEEAGGARGIGKLSSAGSDSFFLVGRSGQREGSNNSSGEERESFIVVGGDESNGSASDQEAGSMGSIEEVEMPQGEQEQGHDKVAADADEEPAETEDKGEHDIPDGAGDTATQGEPKPEAAEREPVRSASPPAVEPDRAEMQLDLREDRQTPSPAAQQPPLIHVDSGTPVWTHAQMTGSLASVKLVIGLAGVYDITDHYEHESWRGIEDLSCMARSMFGPQHFDRFSPTFIVKHLPQNTRMPAVQLIHGDQDIVVPDSSSMKLGKALWEMGCRNVEYHVIPKCNHFEVCLDLMDPDRKWYTVVMDQILRATNFHLKPL